jgi:hypothetical protein
MRCQTKKKLMFEQERSDSLTSGAVTSHDNVRICRSGTTTMRALNGHTRSLFSVKPTIGSSRHREWKKIENTGASLVKDMRISKIILVISRNGERRLICGLGTWQRSTRSWENWRRAPCIDRDCVNTIVGMEYNASPLVDIFPTHQPISLTPTRNRHVRLTPKARSGSIGDVDPGTGFTAR